MNPLVICFATYASCCHPAAKACSHDVEVSAMLPYPYGVGEKFCHVLRGIDEVGSAMESVKQGEDDAEKVNHGGERPVGGICVGVA